MLRSKWQQVATAPNGLAAQAIVGLLEGQGVACQVRNATSLLGEAQTCAVLVEERLLHRAKWLLSQAKFTDAELTFLAVGELTCDDAKE